MSDAIPDIHGGGSGTSRGVTVVGNEEGIVLIIVLVILLLLSILGASILSTSTSELRITGTYRTVEDTFYATDAAMEFAQTSSIIYSALIPGSSDHWPAAGSGTILDAQGNSTGNPSSDRNYNEMPINGKTVKVKVDYASTGPVPAGFGTESDSGLGAGSGFKANFYVVEVIGQGTNSTQVGLESTVARIVPK
ncbi:PilX N-terminal domain-containing pilus assembly protein [Geobacter pickeringii]|uniref:Type 4 fimbrial biogenesis protein PilX N-terminal domain-containing protein n=1 Tax=Geobacter pickeringii TaxID=345632 RepID=A0A0B5BEE2_9BACT|nr:PilX N-terminal domain-containing pilus assembly protein [Geobacter pickeringii]AJE02895.1 hypothetical protein GPICK_05500 [Geobacter pickeringii]